MRRTVKVCLHAACRQRAMATLLLVCTACRRRKLLDTFVCVCVLQAKPLNKSDSVWYGEPYQIKLLHAVGSWFSDV